MVTDTITIGSGPDGIIITPDGTKAYVASWIGTVSVINTSTNTVSATIPVGNGAYGIDVSPDGTMVYVSNSSSHSVSVINTASDTVSATVTVGNGPRGVSVSPDGSVVYVANYGTNTISVINTATNLVSMTIPVSSDPFAFGNFMSPFISNGIPSLNNEPPILSLYPNPNNGIFTLKGDLRFTNYDLRITDIMGREVYHQPINQSTQATIDISQCSNGVYFYQLTDEKGSVRGKLVKE
jgi:YVTN family beta-propeller protein